MAHRPALFEQTSDVYIPTGLGQSVWSAESLGGVAVAALLAVLLENAVPKAPLLGIARLTIDILGVVPHQPLKGNVFKLRDGSRMQQWVAELVAEDRIVARASALCLREGKSPHFMQEKSYPPPGDTPVGPFLPKGLYHDFMRTRPIQGSVMTPGPGTVWTAMDFDAVRGQSISPFVRACLLADFGHGVGSPLSDAQWSWANVDITINFLRMPRGEWLLIDALSQSAGNGWGIARSVFADEEGVYAYGAQTLFVAPAEASPS